MPLVTCKTWIFYHDVTYFLASIHFYPTLSMYSQSRSQSKLVEIGRACYITSMLKTLQQCHILLQVKAKGLRMTYSLYMTFHSLTHLPSDLISNPLSLVHSALAIQTSFLFLEYAKAYLDSQSLLFLFSLPGILFFKILTCLTISSISDLYLKFTFSMRTFLNTLITCLFLPQHCLSHYFFILLFSELLTPSNIL